MNKIYMRTPEHTDVQGTYARLFVNGEGSITISEKQLKLLDNSAVLRVDNKTLKVKVGNEVLEVQLSETQSRKLAWIWLCQPQYRPKDTIKGFVVIREKISEQCVALRKASGSGFLKLVFEDDKVVKARPIEFNPMVMAFEFETDEYIDQGDYKIQLVDDKELIISETSFSIHQFEKDELMLQTESPSWIKKTEDFEISVKGQYFHGSLVKDGTITVSRKGEIIESSNFQGETTFVMDGLKEGRHEFTIELKDSKGRSNETAVSVVVSDVSAEMKVSSPEETITKIPTDFSIIITDPVSTPIPEVPVLVNWKYLGKEREKEMSDLNETYFTDDGGISKFDITFPYDGTYQFTVRAEVNGEIISATKKVFVDRMVQGYFELENELSKKEFDEGETIKGKVAIRGEKSTLKGIKFGYADLITDRIVETKRIEIKDGKAEYEFDGVMDFYGSIAVDVYINTNMQEITPLCTLELDKAGCLVNRSEASITTPFPMKVKLDVDMPNQATTGSEITLSVKVNGDLINENFHIFGALVDHRIMMEHLDTNLYKTFLTKPKAMKVSIKESERIRQPVYRGGSHLFGRPIGGGPTFSYRSSSRTYSSSGGRRQDQYQSRSFVAQSKSLGSVESDSFQSSTQSTQQKATGLGNLKDELLGELTRLKRIMGDSEEITPIINLMGTVVRTNFAESVMIRPKKIERGRVEFTITVPDAISNFECFLFGVGETQFALETETISVKNPVFTQVINPSKMTLGDVVEIKAIVENTTDHRIPHTTMRMYPIQGTEIVSNAEVDIKGIDPRSSVSVSWLVKGTEVGYAMVGLETSWNDFLEFTKLDQPIYINPPNEPTVESENCYITEENPVSFTWEKEEDVAFALGSLNVLPTMETAVIDGLESLAQYPHGCCEQTCASTLPNVVVYEYLEARNQLSEETKATLIKNMQHGLDILLEYRNSDGGFSYWGRESTVFYTALALSVIAKIKPYVKRIPDELFEDAMGYLKQRQTNGLWFSRGGARVAPVSLERHSMTAFILHSLAEGGISDVETFDTMMKQLEKWNDDPTAVALMLRCIGLHDAYRKEDWEMELKDALMEMKTITDDGMVGWKGGSALTRNDDVLSVETTSYALLALHTLYESNPQFYDTFHKGVEFLLSKRGTNGWRSTRDTLYASISITQLATGEKPNFDLSITVNGKEIFSDHLDEDNMAWKVFDFRDIHIDGLKNGKNEVEIEMKGSGKCHLARELKRWYHGSSGRNSMPMSISTTLPSNELEGKETVELKCNFQPDRPCESVMIEVPVPSLLEFKEAKNQHLIDACDHFEIQGNVMCFFFELLEDEVDLTVVLDVVSRGECKVESARAYGMYDPSLEAITSAMELTIK